MRLKFGAWVGLGWDARCCAFCFNFFLVRLVGADQVLIAQPSWEGLGQLGVGFNFLVNFD